MYKLIIGLILSLALTSIAYSQAAKATGASKGRASSETVGFVDIATAEDSIAQLKQEIQKLNDNNSSLKAQNTKSRGVITKSENLIEKVNKLLGQVESERNAFSNYSKEIKDEKTNSINTKAYAGNTETKLKLEKKNAELLNIIKMQKEKINVNNEIIEKNNSLVRYNEKTIGILQASIKKTQDRQKEVKSHADTSSALTNEAEALLKIDVSGQGGAPAAKGEK